MNNNSVEYGMSDAIADMRQGFFFHLNKLKIVISDSAVQGQEGNVDMLLRWCLQLMEVRRMLSGWLDKDTILVADRLWGVKKKIIWAKSVSAQKSYDTSLNAMNKENYLHMIESIERELDGIQISMYDCMQKRRLTAPFEDDADPFEKWAEEAGADDDDEVGEGGEDENNTETDSGQSNNDSEKQA